MAITVGCVCVFLGKSLNCAHKMKSGKTRIGKVAEEKQETFKWILFDDHDIADGSRLYIISPVEIRIFIVLFVSLLLPFTAWIF